MKVEADVLDFPSLVVRTVSVDAEHHRRRRRRYTIFAATPVGSHEDWGPVSRAVSMDTTDSLPAVIGQRTV